jgi:hypothetical protein
MITPVSPHPGGPLMLPSPVKGGKCYEFAEAFACVCRHVIDQTDRNFTLDQWSVVTPFFKPLQPHSRGVEERAEFGHICRTCRRLGRSEGPIGPVIRLGGTAKYADSKILPYSWLRSSWDTVGFVLSW